ncbi:nuclear transport factor 2 family protein [Granulicella sp. S190]|uniref:nuclear transport factor 2 family protein n=1 Tax=Granulicella sp. S190 TaxID=1747226 RepID=UPI00131C61B7|nr:nuclear transport factor 2 family protein [Granulicella sp. S190]
MTWRVRIAIAVTAVVILIAANVRPATGQQKVLSADGIQVVSAVSAIFDAAAHDNLAKFHAVVAPGFYLYDAGARFDGDAIMTLIKAEHAKGRNYEWNVTEPDVHIIGDAAWIAYVNKGGVTDASGTVAQTWLESGFLERRGGVWRVEFMHSTRVPSAPPASSVATR